MAFFHSECLAQQFSYQRYTVDDGLPTNAVYGGMQDSKGYIWFYTEKGISRFDGYGFKNYNIKDGLPANDIFYITEDRAGRLWLHSFAKKLVVLDTNKDSFVTIAEQKFLNNFSFEILSNGTTIWGINYGYGNTISFPDGSIKSEREHPQIDSLKKELTKQGFSNSTIYFYKPFKAVLIDPEKGELLFFDTKIGQVFGKMKVGTYPQQISKIARKSFNAYQPYQDGIYIHSNGDSLIHYLDVGRQTAQHINLLDYFKSIPNVVRFHLQGQQVQVQTSLGLLVLRNISEVEDVFYPNLPPTIQFDRIFKDREGNMWVTSKNKGVFFLTAQERGATNISLPVADDYAITAMASANGRIFCGSRSGNIFEARSGKNKAPLVYKSQSPQFNDAGLIKAISAGKEHLWFIRQSDDIYRLSLADHSAVPLSKLLSKGYTPDYRSIDSNLDNPLANTAHLTKVGKDLIWAEDKQWLAIARGNYSYLCKFRAGAPADVQFMSFKRAYSIAMDSTQKIWLGHNDGLASFENDSYHFHDGIAALNNKNIWDIEIGPDNTLWAGTDGFGLVAVRNDTAVTIKGTENDIIQDIFIGKDHQVWVATNYGVKQIQARQPLSESGVVKVFNQNAGLVTREANGVIAYSQYLYVGTNEGLTRIDLASPHTDSTAPHLYLDQVYVNGRPIPQGDMQTLDYNQNEVEFHFTALSYKSFGNIQYTYQLTGADRAPEHTLSRSVRYSSLSPGTYAFELTATDTRGTSTTLSNPISFTIHPPWWRTRLFYFLCMVSLLASVASIYFIRVRRIRQQAARETAINKRFAKLELQALQSQMNPHFVFNSMSAIQHFIQSRETMLADDYLARFGQLMRLFLESSKKRYITLSEEIEILSLYINLEQARFNGKFSHQLIIDERIDLYSTLIPSVLLQPFVENAINHGLFHKPGPGSLIIAFEPFGEGVRCTIEDDGIGREKAMEIRLRSNKNYKSRAMQMIEERLEALRQFEGYGITFQITDLMGRTGESRGTRVVIEIPEID